MNKYSIQFSKEARNDLIEIYSYIKNELKEPNIANKLLNKIKKEIYKLENYSKIYSVIDDNYLRRQDIRKIKISNYLVFYCINDENKIISILRVLYARRNWLKLL